MNPLRSQLSVLLEPLSRLGKGGSSTWINLQPVEADLLRIIERPLRVVNDADCFAASEATDGAGAGYAVVFGVIIASGTGAGVAINGRAHHGSNNSAGDWGNNPLPLANADELPGDSCYCAKFGCIETWLSGYSFTRDFVRHGGAELKPAEILKLKRAGDLRAIANYERWIDLSSLCHANCSLKTWRLKWRPWRSVVMARIKTNHLQ